MTPHQPRVSSCSYDRGVRRACASACGYDPQKPVQALAGTHDHKTAMTSLGVRVVTMTLAGGKLHVCYLYFTTLSRLSSSRTYTKTRICTLSRELGIFLFRQKWKNDSFTRQVSLGVIESGRRLRKLFFLPRVYDSISLYRPRRDSIKTGHNQNDSK